MKALSWLTKIPATKEYAQDEEHVHEATLQVVQVALRIEEIKEVSYQNEELAAVRESLKTGDWRKAPKAYVQVHNKLTYIGQVVLRRTRTVPGKLHKSVLDSTHQRHLQGVVNTKERLQSKVWWPGVDKEVEKKCRECFGCQLVSK